MNNQNPNPNHVQNGQNCQNRNHNTPFELLPRELLWVIFAFLSPDILNSLQQVCKDWYHTSKDEGMWKARYLSTFNTLYDNIDSERALWRERFWRCYHIHSNWRTGLVTKAILGEYSRTIRQIQINNKYLALSYGDMIEVRDSHSNEHLFHIKPDFKNSIPYLKCFAMHNGSLACSAGNGWTQVNFFNLKEGGNICSGWTSLDNSPIEAISFNDTTLVTGARKCVVWDLQTRTAIRTFTEQQRGVVNCLQFDEQMLVCSHKGRKIRIWDIQSGKRTFTLQGHQHLVHCLHYDERFLATGSKDKTLRVWDKRKGFECVAVLRGHQDSVRALQIDGWKLISGSKDGDVRIWDIASSTPSWDLSLFTQSQSQSTPRSFLNSSSRFDSGHDDVGINHLFNDSTTNGRNIKSKSLCRLAGNFQEPICSLAATSSRLYVGTQTLRLYDFEKSRINGRKNVHMLDKIKNYLLQS